MTARRLEADGFPDVLPGAVGPRPAPPEERTALRLRLAALAGFVVVHLAVSLLAVVPGYLSVDEGTYHLMVKNLADGRPFEIWNGYDELPSPELQVGPIWERGGRLVAAPPEGFTVVALPFYALLGYRGLFLLNALAFLATLALVGRLALRLFGDRVLALDATLVLALATYLWDYAQAAWPHATATLLVAAAMTAAVHALTAAGGRFRLGWALAAGLAAGLGPSVRLDAGFALPAVLLPFLFARPARLREAAAALAGTVPGLVALAAVNHHKFGTWSPFSYGKTDDSVSSGMAPYLPLAALAAAAVAAAWIASRERPAAALRRRPGRVAAAVALAAAAALLVPAARELAARLLAGLWQLVVDLRVRDPSIVEPALGRTPDGGLVYVGALKKSLLQSCPYLTLLAVPAVA
ncbi:MAG TPA: hypothetical protein VHM02_02115, partial [Thermoanaerobaculia bacterium]|nr:hypothetical protein [Thermoanaerobaculia bacterium]